MVKCYHVSPIRNRNSILKKGLVPRNNKVMGYSKKLFFSIDRNNLGFDYVDYSNVDVWSFVLPKSIIKTDKKAWNKCFCYASRKIPAKKIILEETIF